LYNQDNWWRKRLYHYCSSERVLVFILAREQGYATEIARFFNTKLYSIQKQLDNWSAEVCS